MIPKPRPLDNGLVIMFEGIDGVGKTTQLDLLRETLQDADWPVIVTRNLGGTPIGEALRKVMKSNLERPPLTDFYISLAIQEPLFDVVDEARAEGKIVLIDRGPLSLAAYQIYGAGVDHDIGWQHVRSGMDRLKPDAIILYDMDSEAALKRVPQESREADYFESKPLGYFQKVADGFKTAAEHYPSVVTINAAQPRTAVHEQTLDVIARLLK